jgi:hypothetical protein
MYVFVCMGALSHSVVQMAWCEQAAGKPPSLAYLRLRDRVDDNVVERPARRGDRAIEAIVDRAQIACGAGAVVRMKRYR